MDLELAGKVALITGASQGIGKAIARELAREGADIVMCARRPEVLERAASELGHETGRRVLGVPADTSSYGSVRHLVQEAMAAFGRIDILVNNAAAVGGLVGGTLADASEDALLEDVNTKVIGYFRCAKAVAPYMKDQRSGRILNIGGLSGRKSALISGLRNAAVVHLTKSLSDQLGPSGITVNLIHPGTTRTERGLAMYESQGKAQGLTEAEFEERIARDVAIRRIVHAREIGYLAAFLASPKAAAITGVAIDASGGSMRAVYP